MCYHSFLLIQFAVRVQKFGKIEFKEIEKMLSGFAPEVKDTRQSIINFTFGCKRENLLKILRAVGKKRKDWHHMKPGNSRLCL